MSAAHVRSYLAPRARWQFSCALAATIPLTTILYSAELKLPPPLTVNVDYIKDVKPLLEKHCYECHGNGKQQAGLRLDLRQNALRGGDYGPVIVPGNSSKSKFIHKLVDGDGGDVMPPEGEPLTEAEIGLLRAWIDQGADFRNEVAAEAPVKPIDPILAAAIAAVRSRAHAQVISLVTTTPALVTAADPAKSTLLHHAAGWGTIETVAWLIEAGADVNAKNARGSTPLHWAIPEEAKVRLLLARGADVEAKISDGRTPLYQATLLGDGHATLRLLLAMGANPNPRVGGGRTAVMAAASRGDAVSLRLLLDAHAPVNAADSAGTTALMLAAGSGKAAAVRLLLDRGADARAKTKRSETALGAAGTAGNTDVVQLLLAHGAEVNVRNHRGFSPLMLAASSDAIPTDVVKLLLEKGADPLCTADYDETARDLSAKRGLTTVARLLGATPAPESKSAPLPTSTAPRAHSIPDAVERALGMLEKQSYNFIRIAGCNSCHSQDLPAAAVAFARTRGLRVPAGIPQLPASAMPSAERVMDLEAVSVSSKGWELFDLGMNGIPPTAYTDAVVRYMLASQTAEGNWPTNENRRPPMGTGDFQAAALAIYSIKHFAPAGHAPTGQHAVARAVAWLSRAKPETTQDRAFHLLGLAWGGAKPDREGIRSLLAMQRDDGGWSQLPETESDAYATGQVLYALSTAGNIAATHSAAQAAVLFLLRTQAGDGTWRVKTRAIWLQPYFESGFPYGQDQFISAAGTAWAALALTAAQPPSLARQ